jgi:hypothetical protein
MPDRLYNAFQVRHHLLIGKAQNLKSFRGKEGVATLICLLLCLEIMGFSIDLDDELCREAREVYDVIPDGNLPTKADASHAVGLQVTP